MPNYSYYCESCETTSDHLFRIGSRPDTAPCGECDKSAIYVLVPPAIMTHAYLDGTKRKGFQDLKEASKLNRLAAGTDNQAEKQTLKNEIQNKLRVNISKDE